MTFATLLLPFLQFLSILFFIVAKLVQETFDFRFPLRVIDYWAGGSLTRRLYGLFTGSWQRQLVKLNVIKLITSFHC